MKEGGQNNQILALLALIGGTDGFRYAFRTKFGLIDPNRNEYNDILSYGKDAGVHVNELFLGLAGDFIIDSDSWALLKMALGDEKIKLSDDFWKFYYKLGENSPEMGIKAGFKF
ncbi:MAG: hypothetical protein V1698_00750 [bacterium]